jgi:hypothetical protein
MTQEKAPPTMETVPVVPAPDTPIREEHAGDAFHDLRTVDDPFGTGPGSSGEGAINVDQAVEACARVLERLDDVQQRIQVIARLRQNFGG